jgi:hypothetical protein
MSVHPRGHLYGRGSLLEDVPGKLRPSGHCGCHTGRFKSKEKGLGLEPACVARDLSTPGRNISNGLRRSVDMRCFERRMSFA